MPTFENMTEKDGGVPIHLNTVKVHRQCATPNTVLYIVRCVIEYSLLSKDGVICLFVSHW